MTLGKRLRLGRVEGRACNPAVVECGSQRGAVDEASPGDIHQVHAGLDQREGARVHHPSGASGRRRREDEMVRARQQLVERRDDFHALERSAPRVPPESDDLHAERERAPRDLGSDVPEADEPEGAAVERSEASCLRASKRSSRPSAPGPTLPGTRSSSSVRTSSPRSAKNPSSRATRSGT
jgi:hypothetical protein